MQETTDWKAAVLTPVVAPVLRMGGTSTPFFKGTFHKCRIISGITTLAAEGRVAL